MAVETVEEFVRRAPKPLKITIIITMIQAAIAVIIGLLELFNLVASRATMGAVTTIFFVLYGSFLIVAARQLSKLSPWARGPVLLSQLIWLGVAWSFIGGATTWVAVVLALSALAALAGLLHPDSRHALDY